MLYVDPNFIRKLTTERSEARRRVGLGRMSEHGMAKLIKRELLVGYNMTKLEFCEHRIFGKHKKVKFNASVHTTKVILEYVHADRIESLR
jgi:hypothetical protein